MKPIKCSEGPWGISSESPTIIKQFDGLGETNVIIGSASSYDSSPYFPSKEESLGNAKLFSAAHDMALILEIIHDADDDARRDGLPCMTSGVRLALDAALIKAGRKAAPEPVRHMRICGEGL
ncbi:hypothetical protein [Burkholderia sp. Bp8995]|uniref:hypothetical protein n=1 Tax=Burkholderia sp. Bp8995 TaxID=2184556 RepID=UPI0021AB96A7|nr:hypothetical protein [Burkholderia sp. Bp8995]